MWEWLTTRYAPKRLTLNTSPQLDLGMDSIKWLNVTLEIGKRTGVDLSEEAISRIDTVRDLL
ncbi:acyl carrier protein [Nitrosomonas communis]|uniref:acyl carrier protein n=1 Tax=Nitrosomonas communis TaxID=44574 RepID=UPI000943A83C|nr:acyl carrier protein [Nitrosomonas communis]